MFGILFEIYMRRAGSEYRECQLKKDRSWRLCFSGETMRGCFGGGCEAFGRKGRAGKTGIYRSV